MKAIAPGFSCVATLVEIVVTGSSKECVSERVQEAEVSSLPRRVANLGRAGFVNKVLGLRRLSQSVARQRLNCWWAKRQRGRTWEHEMDHFTW